MARRSGKSGTVDLNADRPTRNCGRAVGPAVVGDARRLLVKIEELYGPNSRAVAHARDRVVRLEEQAKPMPVGIRCLRCRLYRLSTELLCECGCEHAGCARDE